MFFGGLSGLLTFVLAKQQIEGQLRLFILQLLSICIEKLQSFGGLYRLNILSGQFGLAFDGMEQSVSWLACPLFVGCLTLGELPGEVFDGRAPFGVLKQ